MTSINIGLVLTVSYILLFCRSTTASPHGLRLTFEEHVAALATGETEHVTHPQEHDTCDKRLCASIVSYCLIQEACDCDTSDNCSCCHECAICLGDKFEDCSDCVGKFDINILLSLYPTVYNLFVLPLTTRKASIFYQTRSS